MQELMKTARRVTQSITKDPEAESHANEAVWRATLRFNPNNGAPLEAFVVYCVRMAVLDYCRRETRRHEELRESDWWERVCYYEVDDSDELVISDEDRTLLTEKFVDNLPWDVVARRRGVSVYRIRKDINAALSRVQALAEAIL